MVQRQYKLALANSKSVWQMNLWLYDIEGLFNNKFCILEEKKFNHFFPKAYCKTNFKVVSHKNLKLDQSILIDFSWLNHGPFLSFEIIAVTWIL